MSSPSSSNSHSIFPGTGRGAQASRVHRRRWIRRRPRRERLAGHAEPAAAKQEGASNRLRHMSVSWRDWRDARTTRPRRPGPQEILVRPFRHVHRRNQAAGKCLRVQGLHPRTETISAGCHPAASNRWQATAMPVEFESLRVVVRQQADHRLCDLPLHRLRLPSRHRELSCQDRPCRIVLHLAFSYCDLMKATSTRVSSEQPLSSFHRTSSLRSVFPIRAISWHRTPFCQHRTAGRLAWLQ